jgi:hypothetical protein
VGGDAAHDLLLVWDLAIALLPAEGAFVIRASAAGRDKDGDAHTRLLPARAYREDGEQRHI